jgi:hypothetical protein
MGRVFLRIRIMKNVRREAIKGFGMVIYSEETYQVKKKK